VSQTLAAVCTPAEDARTSWLTGIRVLCSHRSKALEVAGRVMDQFGAEIVYADERSDSRDPGDTRAFDVVLEDRVERESSLMSDSDLGLAAYLNAIERVNPGVWVTVSAFGLSEQHLSSFASEVTLLASAGILGHSWVEGQDAPTIPAAPIGMRLVGTVTAVAALHARHEHLSAGVPIHVDLSAQGAVIATGLTLEMGHALANCPDQGGSGRYGAPTGMFACADGFVYVIVLEEHQWRGLQGVIPALQDIESMEQARLKPFKVNAAVTDWLSTRSQLESESMLQAAGVPCTAVNSVGQFVERVRTNGRSMDIDGPLAPMLPARLSSGQNPAGWGRGASSRLSDVRVLDAGHVLAVPLATAWLGAMGARVSKLEDPERLDVYRRRGPFAEGVPGLNRSAYFNHINFCKTSLDLTLDAHANADHIAEFDVVISNLSPHRARRLGVDPDGVEVGETPKFVMTSSGFGLDGELAGYRAYGTNIHAFSGLVAATRDYAGNMAGVGTPWADPLTSVAIAAWVLAWSLDTEARENVAIDLSMAEVLAAQMSELLERTPEQLYDLSSGVDFFVRTADATDVLAVSITTAVETAEFERITHAEVSSLRRRGDLLTVDGSVADNAEKLELLLQQAGLMVGRVVTAKDLARDDKLVASGLFKSVQSPALGTYLVTGLPWRLVGRAPRPLRAAPERPAEGG
jgi:crotonobetainyl-CoA:carnitine CoA-transferase CaiB-like acyl-CoA transferase